MDLSLNELINMMGGTLKFTILSHLWVHRKLYPSELAKMIDVSRTQISRELSTLEEQNLIIKSKIDGKNEEELEKLAEKIEKELDPKKTELEMLNKEKMEKIRKDIIAAVENVSREVGVDVVVDKQVIITGGIDLTDLAITKLNK